jgi:Transposase DDE domain
MSQRRPDLSKLAFGRQALASLVELLCQHLPLNLWGLKINDPLAWTILCYAASRRTTIEQAALSLKTAPSANTIREHLREALPVEIAEVRQLEPRINRALQAQLPRRLAKRLRRTRLEVAGDLTDIPYHGEPEREEAEVRRSQAKSGTTHFHSYATLQVVHHRQRLTIAVTFVAKGETMAAVVTRLLRVARRSGVRIRRAYFDKGFASVAVFRLLRARRIPYLIAVPARGGAGGLKQFFGGCRNRRLRYTFGRTTQKPYTTEVVIVRREWPDNGVRYFAYATYRLGGMAPVQVFEAYRRRFSIESGYRQSHQVRARTASRHPGLRLALFSLSLLLVNAWVLCSQVCAVITRYGCRWRLHDLTLTQLALALDQSITELLGLRQIEQACKLDAIT